MGSRKARSLLALLAVERRRWVVEGGEQITRDLLDVIVVDHATESAAPKPPRPRETRT